MHAPKHRLKADPIEFHLDWVAERAVQLEMEQIAAGYGFDVSVLELHGPGGGNLLVSIGLGGPHESEAYSSTSELARYQQRLIGFLMGCGYGPEDLMLCAANEATKAAVLDTLRAATDEAWRAYK